jgi:Uma2 family endonuclease
METVKSRAEQRVLLRNIGWETYERLLYERGDSRVPRLAYDRGDLEIMSPSSEHESVAYFVALLAEEMRVNAYGVGSTTYRRGDIGRGFEPDGSFYIRNEERIRGKPRIDLSVDPPPDLVIEVDITSPSLDKFPIYARLGVHEVWRYDGERMTILVLEGSDYAKTAESIVLPPVTSKVLTDFVEKIKSVERKAWLKEVREWSRENTGTSSRTRPYLSCGQRSEGSCSPRLTL